MTNDQGLEQNDILLVSKFPQNANHIYLGLIFLNKYKLNSFRKSLYEQAGFAEILLLAGNHLVDSTKSLFESKHPLITILDIFRAMFHLPECSLLLVRGIVLIYNKHSYYFDFFEHYKFLCDNQRYAQELARAFIILADILPYRASRTTNIKMIIQYPQHATEIASALNLLMTRGIYVNNHRLLQSNPREATVIAKLVSCLESRELMDLNIHSAIVDNSRHVKHVYNIVAVLSRWTSMLNVNVLNTIFNNSDAIPEIAEKLLAMSVGENSNFDLITFGKMIDEVKEEKRKIEFEKEKKKQEEAGLAPKAKISPLDEVRDCLSALGYLKDNIYNKKEIPDKAISIDLIKKVFMQLLQVGLHDRNVNVLNDMSSLFYLITVDYHKVMVNIHKNSRYDALFGKSNTNAWTEMMKIIRDQAYQLLMVLVENEPDNSKKIALLEQIKDKAIFAEHRTNSFFNRFHQTTTIKEINNKIEALCAPVPIGLNK